MSIHCSERCLRRRPAPSPSCKRGLRFSSRRVRFPLFSQLAHLIDSRPPSPPRTNDQCSASGWTADGLRTDGGAVGRAGEGGGKYRIKEPQVRSDLVTDASRYRTRSNEAPAKQRAKPVYAATTNPVPRVFAARAKVAAEVRRLDALGDALLNVDTATAAARHEKATMRKAAAAAAVRPFQNPARRPRH